jgi:hypothetical protein
MFRSVQAIAVAVALSLSLVACTPPMPPEVLAGLAEQEYTCVEGETVLSLPASTTSLGEGWAISVSEACPGMNLTPAFDTAAASDLLFTTNATDMAICAPTVEVPFAVDGAVLVYISADGNTLVLTPELVGKILSGEVSDWADSTITEVNQGVEVSSGPILINKVASKVIIDSFTNWLSILGTQIDLSDWKIGETTSEDLFAMEPGTLALISNSLATENVFTPVGIQIGDVPGEGVINPDSLSIGAAATQFEISKTENNLSVSYNSKLPALAAPGQETASVPYGAVFTYNLGICGEATLAKRAMARFILRIDQQGSIGATYFVPISETMRVEALSIVSEGLTLPVIDPENLPAE